MSISTGTVTPVFAKPTSEWLISAPLLVTIMCALVVPYGMILTVGAGVTREVFPAYTLIVGAVILVWRRALYPAYVLALFAFSAFLRRVVGYHAGFATFDPVLLGPYTALLLTIPALMGRVLGKRPLSWPFAVILFCIVYASIVSLVQMRFVPGLYSPLRWLLPVSLCTFIMENPQHLNAMRRGTIGVLLIIVPILSLYGVARYLGNAPLRVETRMTAIAI